MAIEIEKKYRLTDEQREQVLANLKDFGAEYLGEEFEINELYGNVTLRKRSAVVRVRKIQDKTILTYKQRLASPTAIKHQIEYETEVADAEAIGKIIESLGFKKLLVYEKRRQTWRLKNIEVLIDELPFGLFMEIEGTIANIGLAEELLEAADFQTEHETYPMLTKKFGKLNGEKIEARFE
jgi:adenylate cyclase, class 2